MGNDDGGLSALLWMDGVKYWRRWRSGRPSKAYVEKMFKRWFPLGGDYDYGVKERAVWRRKEAEIKARYRRRKRSVTVSC